MTAPFATYRLQFRNGMTFEQAAALVGYLERLGVSHIYASPLFAAAPGSTHGYDGIDFAAIEPAIGGEEGFNRLSVALTKAGLGLILDFVPNHMAANEANRWWQAVLEWGPTSPFARYFDVDWSAPKLLLPILGVPYGKALEDGTFGLAFDAESGSFGFTYDERRLPLTPPSYGMILERADDPAVSRLAWRFAGATPEEGEDLKRLLAEQTASPAGLAAIAHLLDSAKTDVDLLHALHEAQIWRLAHWRLAREALTYRRFFEIADLVCLRVEDLQVFDAAHARLFDLVRAGRIAGIRLDHIDGLADPKAYLERFVRTACGATPCTLLVEKILERDEHLRADWPVAGTTGYEFIAALSGLFVDGDQESEMTLAYDDFTGAPTDYGAALRAAKREIFERNLAAELAGLAARAGAIAASALETRDLGADSLRRAIVELAAALPVYRSYVDATGPMAADRALIAEASADAKAVRAVEDGAAVDYIARLLLLDVECLADHDQALDFTVRFQQSTGPVMAKAAEDTLFYRYNRLVSLNEVGGAPERYGAPVDDFHAAMARRRDSQPAGLSATSTHDTKRGEDARARIYVLSETPEAWGQAVVCWREMNRPHHRDLPDGAAPEPAIEWLFYQALVGAWPADLARESWGSDADASLETFRERMGAFMTKAVREAKLRTSWTNPDAAYESAVADFVNAVLTRETGGEFLLDFARRCRPVWLAGAINGLAQLVVKLAAPGVPDFYQGSELWDFSLVDPDNRSPIDFALRQRLLEAAAGTEPARLLDDWTSGAPKMALTVAGLQARAERPLLFARGSYGGLAVRGHCARHMVAFIRHLDEAFAIVVAPRLVLALSKSAERPLVPAERWADTAIELPPAIRGRAIRDVVTGRVHKANALKAADALKDFPVAFLLDTD